MEKENKNIKSFVATHKKAFWIGGAVILLGVIAITVVLPKLGRGSAGLEMETTAITTGTIVETVDTFGVLEAQPSVTLQWKSDGTVADFDYEIGDSVEEGDIIMDLEASSQNPDILNAYEDLLEAQYELDLITIADSDYQKKLEDLVYQEQMLINKHADKLAWNYGESSEDRLDAVRANYMAARAEVWTLEAAYDELSDLDNNDPIKVEALEDLEDGKVKRDSLLRALNQILGIEFDIAIETDFNEFDQQTASVAEARVAYNNYVDQSEEIRAAQAKVQSLQNKVNQAKIIVPSSGTITAIYAVPGEYVEQGEVAVQVDNLDNLIVEVSINEEDINKVEVGQTVILTFDAIAKKEYTGFVLSVDEDGTENANGVVEYNAEIKMEDADEDVKPGFTAVVSIVVDSVEDGLLVANDAIIVQEDGTTMLAVIGDDGAVEMIPVEVGAESDAYTQVTSDEIADGLEVSILPTAIGGELGGSMMDGGGRPGGGQPGGGEPR